MALPQLQPEPPVKPPEIGNAPLCQIGQDLVQELVQKVNDVFLHLKLMQLPNGTTSSTRSTQNVANKIREELNQIEQSFKNLHHVYKECQRRLPDDVEPLLLVPYVNNRVETDSPAEELPLQKSGKELMLEQRKKEYEQILRAKNQQMKKLVQEMRDLVWEANSVISLLGAV